MFVHLHNHSEYSLPDGGIKIADMVSAVRNMDMSAVALTDHGVMYGVAEFADACLKAGIKPIIGVEAYITPFGVAHTTRATSSDTKRPPVHHILLLARNQEGYRNLCRLVAASYHKGFYYHPRIDHDLLDRYGDGLIVTSACLENEIPHWVAQGRFEKARDLARWYRNRFGEYFYIEVQRHGLPDEARINQGLLDIARELSIPVVATNDAHYLTPEDAERHECLIAARTGKLLADPQRLRFFNNTFYLAAPEEMAVLFADIPEAIKNTTLIAQQCDVALRTKQYYLPALPIPAHFAEPSDMLTYLAQVGFEAAYGIPSLLDTDGRPIWACLDDARLTAAGLSPDSPDIARARHAAHAGVLPPDDQPLDISPYRPHDGTIIDKHPDLTPNALRSRLHMELQQLNRMNLSLYMLVVHDLIQFCRSHQIWWNIRGSAAGSLVCYVLGLTSVEPVSNELYFERFLNPERVSMPDIDIDFPDDQRHLLIDYVKRRYGADHVAQIVTFSTLGARAAIRDAARITDDSPQVSQIADQMANTIPTLSGANITLDAVFQAPNSPLAAICAADPTAMVIYQRAKQIEGYVRNISQHAAGVVITDAPVMERLPVQTPPSQVHTYADWMTQFEMTHLEGVGILKMDFLGLDMLSVLREACEYIAQTNHVRYTLSTIPVEHPLAFELLGNGNVDGIFQVENKGMRGTLMRMRPRTYAHVVALLALYRPGPLEYIDEFIKRMHGESYQLPHPDLENALRETYGIMVYQEQIMRVARDIAGYTMGEADMIRKAVAKKDAQQLANHHEKFVQGAVRRGYPEEVANRIWGAVEQFARYGFNKAHAAAYAAITCKCAFLKAHYPTEYLCALLKVKARKGESLEKIGRYIEDARKQGVLVLPPDINRPSVDFAPTRENGRPAIIFGLGAIKNFSANSAARIAQEHQSRGRFTSFGDAVARLSRIGVNKREIEALILCGAMDALGERNAMLHALPHAMRNQRKSSLPSTQNALLSLDDDARVPGDRQAGSSDATSHTSSSAPAPMSDVDKRAHEIDLLGVAFAPHPAAAARARLNTKLNFNAADLVQTQVGQKVTGVGLVTEVRIGDTRTGGQYATMRVSDETGECALVAFSGNACWQQAISVGVGDVIQFSGTVSQRGSYPKNIMLNQLKKWDDCVTGSSADVGGPSKPNPPRSSTSPKICAA